MGGILGGLFDLLGGARDLKRQEKEGYDWREKQAQAEFQRQQEREQARQQNELAESQQDARLKNELSDILAGAGEGEQPDLESLLPQNIENLRRQRIIRGALGAGKERKSALQAQKLQADQARRESQDAAAMQREQFKAEQRKELMQEAERIRADQTMSPREKSMQLGQLQNALTLLDRRAALRPAGGGQARPTKVVGSDEQGRAGTWLIYQDGNREFMPAAATAGTRGKEESRGAAMGAFDELMQVYDSMGGQPEEGISARLGGMTRRGSAALGYNPEARTYQAGVRGFVPLMARALGHTGVLTELDVARTEALFPGPGDTAEEAAQKRRILEEIMSGRRPAPFMEKNQQSPVSPRRRKFNPATGRLE